ncbi:lipid II:glycine glycyltransferase FemX [Mycobacterium sp. NPDC048908]|uniref:lipid II:glycine glycyltransferase FemX n=1 Tax=Mycobacterium sp. NPDC048908 TaxID=3364292 RepID=UPI00371BB194
MSFGKRAKNAQPHALRDGAAPTDGSLSAPVTGNQSRELSVTLTRQPDASTTAAWDELVQNVPGSDVAQLSAWADVRRAAGFQPLYVFVQRGIELVGGALVLGRRLPLIGEVGYIPYGPVVRPEADRDPVAIALATALRRLARTELRMIFVQPPLGGNDVSLELQRQGFRSSAAGIAPTASLRLDLDRDEDELRAGLRRRLQRWTRNWPNRGVRVRRGTQQDVALLARLHAASALHQNFEPLPLDYLENLYRRLAPTGHAELFVGEIDGKPVAARLYTSCGGVLKERLLGMDRDSEAAKLSVPAAVEWEAIRWAKASGYQWVDFGGISDKAASILEDERSDSSKLTSAEAFKASFGGTPFRYPTPVEIMSSPVIRIAYDLAQRWPVGRRMVKRTTHHLLRIGRGSRGAVPIR